MFVDTGAVVVESSDALRVGVIAHPESSGILWPDHRSVYGYCDSFLGEIFARKI